MGGAVDTFKLSRRMQTPVAQAQAQSKITRLLSGSVIYLSNEAAIAESMRQGKGVKPLEVTVKEVLSVVEAEKLATWNFARLEQGGILMEKIVDSEVSFTFYKDPGFPVRNRQGNLDEGNQWLFQAPSSENFNVRQLKYTTTFDETLEEDGKQPRKIQYVIKDQGELSGYAKYIPAKNGLDKMLGTVVEYASETGEQALILEIGESGNKHGGAIYLYNLGTQLKTSEVTFL